MDHLQDDLREAYGKSAQIACEQIAAIRTVASLRRENALHREFVTSLDAPVRKAMLSTTKSTFVLPLVSMLTVVLFIQSERSTVCQCMAYMVLLIVGIIVLVWKYAPSNRRVYCNQILRLSHGDYLWCSRSWSILLLRTRYHKSNIRNSQRHKTFGTSTGY